MPLLLPAREPAKIKRPDLVFSVYQAVATDDGTGIQHAFTLRNIGEKAIAQLYFDPQHSEYSAEPDQNNLLIVPIRSS